MGGKKYAVRGPDWLKNSRSNNLASYFSRLFVAENLPNTALVLVGIAGIIVAVFSLKAVYAQIGEMRRQVDLTFGQLKAMHEQITEMSEQTALLQKYVSDTEVIAKAGLDSAKAANANAQVLVSSERAWLTVKVENFQPGGKLIHIAIPIKNNGRTSAKVKKIMVTRHMVPFPENSWGRPGELPQEPIFDSTPTTVVEGKDFIIPPEETHRAHVWIFPEDYTQIRERKTSLYVYGVIDYLDTLREEGHKTGFCEIYWVPEQGSTDPEGFMFSPNLIPETYICAT
jgi:hypothetical protein